MRSFQVAILFAVLASSPGYAASAQAFLTDAIKQDNSEIKLGQLAHIQGASEGVRRLGKTLVDDHSSARAQATEIAGTESVHVTLQMTTPARTEYDELGGLRGAAFDRSFLDFVIKDHKQEIRKFEAEANDKTPIGRLARDQLPILKKHLQTAESLKEKLSARQ